MISIKDLSFTYERARRSLKYHTTIYIRGWLYGIIGPSGAGKTTCQRRVRHYTPPLQGYLLRLCHGGGRGLELSLTTQPGRHGSAGYRQPAYKPVVEDELYYGLENFGVSKAEAEERVNSRLGDRHTGLRRRYINTLSGGQKQKVAIASIVALQPRYCCWMSPPGSWTPTAAGRYSR